MVNTTSTAPMDRIHITYPEGTADSENQREIELPLKLLFIGDYVQRQDSRRFKERQPIRINDQNFAAVMDRLNPELTISVPNALMEGDASLEVHLQFKCLQDFEPDSIVNQVPELRQLSDQRAALAWIVVPLCNNAEFRSAIQEASTVRIP